MRWCTDLRAAWLAPCTSGEGTNPWTLASSRLCLSGLGRWENDRFVSASALLTYEGISGTAHGQELDLRATKHVRLGVSSATSTTRLRSEQGERNAMLHCVRTVSEYVFPESYASEALVAFRFVTGGMSRRLKHLMACAVLTQSYMAGT